MAKPLKNGQWEIPKLYRGIVRRAKTSRAYALKAMCLQCVGYERLEVTRCTAQDCPLWTWRPYQKEPPTPKEP